MNDDEIKMMMAVPDTLTICARPVYCILFSIGQNWPAQAGERLRRGTESGDAKAQFELGQYYGNDAQSQEYFQKAYF